MFALTQHFPPCSEIRMQEQGVASANLEDGLCVAAASSQLQAEGPAAAAAAAGRSLDVDPCLCLALRVTFVGQKLFFTFFTCPAQGIQGSHPSTLCLPPLVRGWSAASGLSPIRTTPVVLLHIVGCTQRRLPSSEFPSFSSYAPT